MNTCKCNGCKLYRDGCGYQPCEQMTKRPPPPPQPPKTRTGGKHCYKCYGVMTRIERIKGMKSCIEPILYSDVEVCGCCGSRVFVILEGE